MNAKELKVHCELIASNLVVAAAIRTGAVPQATPADPTGKAEAPYDQEVAKQQDAFYEYVRLCVEGTGHTDPMVSAPTVVPTAPVLAPPAPPKV